MDIFNMQSSDRQDGLVILVGILARLDETFEERLGSSLEEKVKVDHPFIDGDVNLIGHSSEALAAGGFLYINRPKAIDQLALYVWGDMFYASYHERTETDDDYDIIERYMIGPFSKYPDDADEEKAVDAINKVFALLSWALDIPIVQLEITEEQYFAALSAWTAPNAF